MWDVNSPVFYTGGLDGVVRVVDARSCKIERLLGRHRSEVLDLGVSKYVKYLPMFNLIHSDLVTYARKKPYMILILFAFLGMAQDYFPLPRMAQLLSLIWSKRKLCFIILRKKTQLTVTQCLINYLYQPKARIRAFSVLFT